MTDSGPVVVLDLDGTLVDSVYQHVVAWSVALQEADIDLSVWKIHRRIGMSGGLMVQALFREAGRELTESALRQIQDRHTQLYLQSFHTVRLLPGAAQLLAALTEHEVPWAIATSGRRSTAQPVLDLLKIPEGTPVVTHEEVARAKPDPDLFLYAAQMLGVRSDEVVVVGDSVWDLLAARRAQALGIGLLSGGYGQQELEVAGAYRIYDDPAGLLEHLDEIGIRH
jgi:HAD superfamily hydrolase (TIGR01549 family)